MVAPLPAPMPSRDAPEAERFAWSFTKIAQVDATQAWGGLWHVVSPEFAREGWRQGAWPDEVAALGAAIKRRDMQPRSGGRDEVGLGAYRFPTPWSTLESERATRIARTYGRLNWVVVAACIDAGQGDGFTLADLRAVTATGRCRDFTRAQWADVAACVLAAMPVANAVEHVIEGRDMAPVRVVAALSA